MIIVSIEIIEGLWLQMARLLTPPTSSLRKVLGDIKHHYVFPLNQGSCTYYVITFGGPEQGGIKCVN